MLKLPNLTVRMLGSRGWNVFPYLLFLGVFTTSTELRAELRQVWCTETSLAWFAKCPVSPKVFLIVLVFEPMKQMSLSFLGSSDVSPEVHLIRGALISLLQITMRTQCVVRLRMVCIMVGP